MHQKLGHGLPDGDSHTRDSQHEKEQISSTHDDEGIGIATTRRIYLQNFRKVTNVNNIIKLL